MDKNQLYQDLYSNYKKAYPYKGGMDVQDFIVNFWNNAKKQTNFFELVTKKIDECKDRQFRHKEKYFAAGSDSSRNLNHEQFDDPDSTTTENRIPVKDELQEESTSFNINAESMNDESTPWEENLIRVEVELNEETDASLNINAQSMNDDPTSWDLINLESETNKISTPAQDRLQQEIDMLDVEIKAMVTETVVGVLDDKFEKCLQKKSTLLEKKKTKLNKMKDENFRKRKERAEFKRKLIYIYEHIPEARAVLQVKFRIIFLLK